MAKTEQESHAKTTIEMWPVARLIPYVRNPRKNDDAVDRMAASIREFGFKVPVLAVSSGDVVDGHLRLKAAIKLKMTSVPVMLCDEWSQAQVKAFRLMVNRSVAWAQWDDELLALEMEELKGLDFDLNLTGFDEEEWSAMVEDGASGASGGDSLLARMNITIADPTTKVAAGDVWRLSNHVMVCVSVIDGWPVWAKFLTEGSLFCPFPGPFVLLSQKAAATSLVLVQPDPYVAGHIVDRYIEVHGQSSVKRESLP